MKANHFSCWYKLALTLSVGGLLAGSIGVTEAAWQPAKGPLATRWAKDVKPSKVLQEYPRPQMVREKWENLNGLWNYAIVSSNAPQPTKWDGQILVPFPLESALSGVMKPLTEKDRLWYQRTFKVSNSWRGQRVMLHFGAVDWETTVFVNGKEVGTHRGGYDAFSFDITDALKPSGEQSVVVAVWDPTDRGPQAKGKQVLKPGGIMYTATSGIWQTAWLEPVPVTHIQSIKIVPDIDSQSVELQVNVAGATGNVSVKTTVLDGRKKVAAGDVAVSGVSGKATPRIKLAVPNSKLWSPDSPFLYSLEFSVQANGKTVDEVTSYFGMRKISMAKDSDGILRLCLNNKPLFQYGPLDQGFWPDGIYTAPTDEALRYDIEITKELGCNMARKHVKIEPARWYYWCDKLGLLVWQDMPGSGVGDNKTDAIRPGREDAAKQFETEMKAMIEGLWNHPSIVMWVPFNEGWGQYDTPRICDWVKNLDPSRLVNNASGWTDRKVGDVIDMHNYPGPGVPKLEENRAAVLGEFGGLGLPVKGHSWQDEKNWGYRSFKTSEELTDAYVALLKRLHPMTGEGGLCAAVYTQTTDCEIEVNGMLTYDRAMVKMDQAAITAAAKKLYTPPVKRVSKGELIPPATPLVACDPYFSIWSPADALNEADTVHWTGKPHRLTSLVRIDGKAYRLMGTSPSTLPAMEQKSVRVLPTRSIYTFEGGGVSLALTFLTPALPDDIDILSRPVTYVTYDVQATDGKSHQVAFYFDASAELTVNEPRQQVTWSKEDNAELEILKVGSQDQPILAKSGDDLRIDWGYLYLAVPKDDRSLSLLLPGSTAREAFAANGKFPVVKMSTPLPAAEAPVAALVLEAGKVGKQMVSRWLMVAYDDIYSIQFMKSNLRPYWRRNGWEAADLLNASAKDYQSLTKRCITFDDELMADLMRAGGEKYAKLCALAYRQCFAAGKFVADANGQPIQFCKENHSNGCIGTSDVFYPMAPQFLLFGPSLAKSFLVPFMNYAASERWKFPFAPHDLGTYPKANGQVYGDGERGVNNQMPVEESGNLLCLMAAVSQLEGNANFAGLYWKQLEQWAEYLREKGFDPENQLCTDDFAGHLAHNVNLSAKAICGLGAFGKLCAMRGDTMKAQEYGKVAKEFAQRWIKEGDDGDHFRLAFDKPGTWSQKYNLIWDRILGLGLFPDFVLRKEMDFYKKMQNKYGLPLDNRQTYTKLDWITWTATLTQNRADFDALIDPIIVFINETPDRSPLTDWYQTKTARKVAGFTGRPVIGGVFAQMLYDKAAWQKHASRDKTKAANWATMPVPPVTRSLVPTAKDANDVRWHYTTQKPGGNWYQTQFDASSWKEGVSGFGTRGTPGSVVRTEWTTPEIWLRREFTMPEGISKEAQLLLHHDEDVEVFINGVLAVSASGYVSDYDILPLSSKAKAALKPGKNVFAVHCKQTGGGQYIDVGLVDIVPAK